MIETAAGAAYGITGPGADKLIIDGVNGSRHRFELGADALRAGRRDVLRHRPGEDFNVIATPATPAQIARFFACLQPSAQARVASAFRHCTHEPLTVVQAPAKSEFARNGIAKPRAWEPSQNRGRAGAPAGLEDCIVLIPHL